MLERLYATEGMTDSQIAARYRVVTSAVWFWRRDLGIPGRPPGGGKGYTGPAREVLEGMVANGMRDREIATRLGCSPSAAQAWRARFGIASVGPASAGTIRGLTELAARSIPTRAQVAAIQQMAYGRTLEQAARRLSRTPSGIDETLRRARRRTGARTTAQLVADALRAGLITVPPRQGYRRRDPTAKQIEVAQRYADGMTGPEIAADLWITPVSVRERTSTAMRWAGARNHANLVALLLSRGHIE